MSRYQVQITCIPGYFGSISLSGKICKSTRRRVTTGTQCPMIRYRIRIRSNCNKYRRTGIVNSTNSSFPCTTNFMRRNACSTLLPIAGSASRAIQSEICNKQGRPQWTSTTGSDIISGLVTGCNCRSDQWIAYTCRTCRRRFNRVICCCSSTGSLNNHSSHS